ncbi:MAG: hypothetical protein P4L56_07200 [Candidatus Sulfopaludibacter sp.]|nr:hypothetical protein [Candidatus Sulfopaludibacter sp.]
MTRRALFRMLHTAALHFAARAMPVPGLEWSDLNSPGFSAERRYRVDAQVFLLGIPFLHRQGVGGGSVLWRESAEPGAGLLRLLEFHGYSLPARAAGLNRLGFIRELSRWKDGKSLESIYFGLMTASPEESAEQARGALHSTAKEQTYTAIDGRIVPSGSEVSIAHFSAPSTLSGAQQQELLELARKALAATARSAGGPAAPQGQAPSFLQALAELVAHPERSPATYIYSGRAYSLWVNGAGDPKTTAYFRQRGLIDGDTGIIRVTGALQRQAGGDKIGFRIWVPYPSGHPLPLRIEYQARSYLRLVFEAVNT